jgi:hypothetical protein
MALKQQVSVARAPHKPATGAGTPGVWLFDPERARITVRNAEAVLAHLPLFLGGWPFGWRGPAGAEICDIALGEQGGAITVARAGPDAITQAFDNPMAAAKGLADALVSVLTARDPQLIALHAAAVALPRGLVLLVGESGAGKSSIAINLALRGHMLFGDDRIAVRLDGAATGTCLGLMPRVPLPLPPSADHRFAAFVEAFSALQTDDTAYLRPPDGVIAEFGDAQPLAAVVLIDRRAGGGTELLPAPRDEIVDALVRHAFAPYLPAPERSSLAVALAGALPKFRISFSDSLDAARTIANACAPAGAAPP